MVSAIADRDTALDADVVTQHHGPDWLVRTLIVGPLVVLLAAYAVIGCDAGSAWPWNQVVHEDGERTLLQTVLYFEHAARELPLDLLMGLSVAGTVAAFTIPGTKVVGPRASQRGALALSALVLVALIVTILVGAFRSVGGPGLLDNLSQLHTRAGQPLRWGAHWRYHFLSQVGLMLAPVVLLTLVARLRGATNWAFGSWLLYVVPWGAFTILSLLWPLSREPFVDARFLGHQARELFTHTLVTIPLACGVCLALSDRIVRHGTEIARPWSTSLLVAVAWFGYLAVGAYLTIGFVRGGSADQGQSTRLTTMVFPHFFEHAFSYAVATAAAAATYLGWLAWVDSHPSPARS